MTLRNKILGWVWFLMKMWAVVALCSLLYVIAVVNLEDRVLGLIVYFVAGLLCTPGVVARASGEEVKE